MFIVIYLILCVVTLVVNLNNPLLLLKIVESFIECYFRMNLYFRSTYSVCLYRKQPSQRKLFLLQVIYAQVFQTS